MRPFRCRFPAVQMCLLALFAAAPGLLRAAAEPAPAQTAPRRAFVNFELWPDDRGVHINAAILGEERKKTLGQLYKQLEAKL